MVVIHIFEKFTLFQKTLFSWTFRIDWDKNSKIGLDILTYFFFHAIMEFWIFYVITFEHLKPVLKKIIAGVSKSIEKFTKSWKLQILSLCDFSFLKLKSSTFASAQNPLLPDQAFKKVSSWWISSNFCVDKVSIWRCQIILIFSRLHFFILYDWS